MKKEKDNMENRLARMINSGFQTTQNLIIKKMDERFDAVDRKFSEIDEKFEEVNYKLDKIDKKLDGHEKTIFNHDGRIDKLEVDAKKMKKVLAI